MIQHKDVDANMILGLFYEALKLLLLCSISKMRW
jgi:hypothetical protein